MPRVRNSPARKKKVKKILDQAKGFNGRRKSVIRLAKQHVVRAGMFSFAHRRKKKGDFRKLWNIRISAALADSGIMFSRFMFALKASTVELNKKSLAYLAAEDPDAFKAVVDAVKSNVPSV